MISDKEFCEIGVDTVVAYSGKDLTDDLIKRCFKLDNAFYRQEFQWDKFEIDKIIKKYPQFCFIFVDKNRGNIVGYSYWFPIKTAILQEFINNKTALLNIKEEYCMDYQKPHVNLFLGGEAFTSGYDLNNLHIAVENLFQHRALMLAKKGIKIALVAFDSVCAYDEQFLVPKTNMKNCIKKSNCNFYHDKYDPNKFYKDSKYCNDLKAFYKKETPQKNTH